MPSEGRVPPSNIEAERAVLGAALIDADSLLYIVDALCAEDFYDHRHAVAFSVMSDMAEKGKPVDEVLFKEELIKRDLVEKVGGLPFIAALTDTVYTTANKEHYCGIVKDKAIHRQLIKVGSDIAALGFSEDGETDDVLASAEQKVYEIADRSTESRGGLQKIKPLVLSLFQHLEEKIEGVSNIGVPSGFPQLDSITGGFQPGSLVIIAARPSMGKSAFALNIAQNASLFHDVNVLIFSIEMSGEELAGRLLSSVSEISLKQLEQRGRIEEDEWARILEAADRLSSAKIMIDDSSTLTTMDLRSKCRRFFSEHRDERSLVVIDYLQLMASGKKTESRQVEVSDISRSLKSIAKEFSVPVIALSQLSRETEKRGSDRKPQLSDLRDSGAIEQDADLVAFLYRKSYYQEEGSTNDNSAELIIKKHRNGSTGSVDLIFRNEIVRFDTPSYFAM